MKKLSLFFILLLSITWEIQARYITEGEAQSKARRFMKDSRLKSSRNGFMKLMYTNFNSEKPDYYVFSKGENSGFIIVSGSDKTDAILGYVESGNFDENNMPENFAYWLNGYVGQIREAESGTCNYIARVSTESAGVQYPLLENIKWDQLSPYNDMCPELPNGGEQKRCASGCVATAFAQIMYYYRWPETGTGTHNYTSATHKFKLSADFGATTYKWDKMTPYYNSESTEESKKAVAELMYHIGVACDMDYDASSGTPTEYAVPAMVQYFNYDPRISCIYRKYFSRDEWAGIIRTEIDNKRPVAYGGSSPQGGHQFIVDGYDANDMFHVNWGWGSAYDGYFKLSILTPAGHGTGGFDGGFNDAQSAVIGIQRPDWTAPIQQFSQLYAKEFNYIAKVTKEVQAAPEFNYNLKDFYNMRHETFKGLLTIGFFQNGKLVAQARKEEPLEMKPFNGFVKKAFKVSVPINKLNLNEKYEVWPIFKKEGDSEWQRVKLMNMGNRVEATVSKNKKGEKVVRFKNVDYAIDFTISDIVIGESYENQLTSVKFNITNNAVEFDDPLYIGIYNLKDNLDCLHRSTGIYTPLPKGETASISFMDNFKLKPGKYRLVIEDVVGYAKSDYVEFEILPTPTEPANLSLVTIGVKIPEMVYRHDFKANLKIHNTGGIYNGPLYVFLLKSKADLETGAYEDLHVEPNVTIEKSPAEKDNTEITVKINTLIPVGKYYLFPAYEDKDETGAPIVRLFDESKAILINLIDGTTEVETVVADENAFEVYPNPVDDVLNIVSAGNVDNVSIFNMNGNLVKKAKGTAVNVSDLISGCYIVIAEIEGKPVARTFIRK